METNVRSALLPTRLERYCYPVFNRDIKQSSNDFPQAGIGRNFNAFKEFEKSSNRTRRKIEYNPHVLNGILVQERFSKRQKTFRFRRLKKHQSLIIDLKPFICEICWMAFHQEITLAKHFRTHSTEEGLYSCDKCSETFSEVSNLEKHVVSHEKDKQFPCNICGRTFYFKRHLLTHSRVHFTTDLYECDVCKKHFDNEDLLKGHLCSF